MDHIKLVVKAPNQKIPDVSVSIDPEWTVRDLKKHLSVEYPSKPSPPDQRLIYSGHLMRDDQRLNDVFHIGEESKDDVYTIHLVCRPIVSGGESGSSQTNLTLSSQLQTTSGTSSRRGSQQMGNPTSSGNQPTTFPTMVPNSLGIETPPLTMPMMMSNPLMTSPMIPMWTPEQIQAMYSQFVTQWQANPTVIPTISTFPTTTVPFVNQPSTSSTSTTQQQSPETVEQLIRQRHGVVSNVQQQQPQLQQPPVREEVNQPAAANVAPGFNNAVIGGPAAVVEDDAEVNNRDWLDWLYWASRAIVLFSIVYFYSSFTRFILVLATAALMYLYQIGAFGRPGEGLFGGGEEDNEAEEVDDPPEGQRAGQQQPHPAEGEQQPQAPQGVRRNSGQNGQQPATPESEQDRLSGLRLCWVVISSLFTSLIPEGPGGAAGNFN